MPAIRHPIVSESGTKVVACGDARLTTYVDRGVVVLTIAGEIYASNVEDVKRHVRALVPDVGALVVDLSRIEFIGTAGLSVLLLVNCECARKDVPWALIPSYGVTRLLRVGDPDGTLPVVGSSDEALARLRRAVRAVAPLRLVPPAD